MPMVDLPASILVGSWVGTYGPFSLLTGAIPVIERITPPVPSIGSHYTASGALIVFNFKGDGTHGGKVRLNFAGTTPFTRVFKGAYALFTDPTIGVVEGTISLIFSDTDKVSPKQENKLEFMMRSPEELVFLLVESRTPILPPPTTPGAPTHVVTAGGSVSHGIVRRALPVVAVEPEGGARA